MQCKQIFISGRSDESYHYWCFMFHCAGLSSAVLSPVRGWYICCRRTRLRFCLSSALLVSAERFILVGLRVNCLLCSLYWHVWVRALDETSTPVQRRSLTEQVWGHCDLLPGDRLYRPPARQTGTVDHHSPLTAYFVFLEHTQSCPPALLPMCPTGSQHRAPSQEETRNTQHSFISTYPPPGCVCHNLLGSNFDYQLCSSERERDHMWHWTTFINKQLIIIKTVQSVAVITIITSSLPHFIINLFLLFLPLGWVFRKIRGQNLTRRLPAQ